MSANQWQTPKLIVLGHGQPAEQVLSNPHPCKVLPGGAPGQSDVSCTINQFPCIACDTPATS